MKEWGGIVKKGPCLIFDTQQYVDLLQKREDWMFVALVIDRLFLIAFAAIVLVGSCFILLSAPALWDRRQPIGAANKT